MIEFGKTLKAAREAKGITVSQLAETTHMLKSVVENLENENFSSFAAPIYGRGFVKLYCEAVGLDPKPMIEEFMEIYNGNRSLAIKERPVQPSTEKPVAEPPQPAPRPAPAPEPSPQPELFDPHPDVGVFSRYATPIREKFDTFKFEGFELAEAKRWIILGAMAIVLIVAIISGISALYRATTSSPKTEPSVETKAQNTEVDNSSRTPITVKPLYID